MKKLVALVLLLVACGGSERPATTSSAAPPPPKPKLAPPTVDAAKTLIANSAEFSDFQFTNAAYTLPMSNGAMNEPAREAAKALAKAGWLAKTGDGIALTEKAKNDRRFLVRANGVVDIVPLAKKEVDAVTRVAELPDGNANADVTWHWTPNEIGKAAFAARYAGTQHATATLMPDGSGGWAVLRVTAAP